LVLVHAKTPTEQIDMLRRENPGLLIYLVESLWMVDSMLHSYDFETETTNESTRIIIYTSGREGLGCRRSSSKRI